jgi:hypothetical protein
MRRWSTRERLLGVSCHLVRWMERSAIRMVASLYQGEGEGEDLFPHLATARRTPEGRDYELRCRSGARPIPHLNPLPLAERERRSKRTLTR